MKFNVQIFYLNSGDDSSMFVNQLLHQILSSSVGVVGLCNLSTKPKSHISRTLKVITSLFVWILVFMSNTKLTICPGSGVGLNSGSITPIGTIFLVTTIKEMLFRNICKTTSSCFPETGLSYCTSKIIMICIKSFFNINKKREDQYLN